MSEQTTYVFDLRSEANLMPFGEPNEELRHNTLNDRDIEDQHTIEAITGLRDELDGIHALKTVQSDKQRYADYYLWEDNNAHKENRIGKFVTVCSNLYTIAVCKSDDDICGVIVDKAGFVGNYDKFGRNEEYGLVATTGVVDVQCESSVQVGDCVVSNDYGVAKATTSKYGYTVLALKNVNGMSCAVISLGAPISHIPRMSQDILDIDKRVRAAEQNATASLNASNDTNGKVNNIYEAIVNASKKNDDSMADMSDIIDAALDDATEAKKIVNQLKIDITKSTTEALESVENAVEGVEKLTQDLAPIMTFSTEGGDDQVGPLCMARYLKDDVATKQEVFAMNNTTNEKISSFQQTAEGFDMLVSSIDKWSVGDYSPSCGLTLEQSQDIINEGMIYVPTASHTETFNDEDKHFIREYYYIWKTNYWEEYTTPKVIFTAEVVPSGVVGQLWYTDSNTAPIGYEAKALYQFNDNKWNKIAMLNGNANNRTTSLIQQTANELKLSVSNTQESVASLTTTVSGLGANIESVAKWSKGGRDSGHTLAAIDQSADQDGATLTLMVANEDGVKEISGASIVLGANDESYFAVNADRVNFTAGDFTIDANHINFEADDFTIHADKIVFDGSQFSSTMSSTYSTKEETNQAKNNAINSANSSTDDKLKNYSTTVETQSLIDQKADSITASVSATYSTKSETSQAKTDAINSANNTTDEKLKNYSTTTEMNSALSLKADSAMLSSYAKTTDVDGKISTVEGKIALGVATDTDGKKYAYLNANADKIKFDANKTIEINATNFQLDSSGNMTATNGNFEGQVTATSGTFSNCTIDDTCTIQGKLTIGNLPDNIATTDDVNGVISTIEGKGYQTYSDVTTITESTISTGDIYAQNLQVKAGNVDGTFSADKIKVSDLSAFGATIGGWNIKPGEILSESYINNNGNFVSGQTISGMISTKTPIEDTVNGAWTRADFQYQSLVDTSSNSYVRFIAGSTPMYYPEDEDNHDAYISITDNARFMVLDDGSLYASAVHITGNGKIGSWALTDGVLHSTQGVYGTYTYLAANGLQQIPVEGYAFMTLHATGVCRVITSENSYNSTVKAIIDLFGNAIYVYNDGPTIVSLE